MFIIAGSVALNVENILSVRRMSGGGTEVEIRFVDETTLTFDGEVAIEIWNQLAIIAAQTGNQSKE